MEYDRARIQAATSVSRIAQKKEPRRMRLLAMSIESDLPFYEKEMQEFVPQFTCFPNLPPE